MQSEEQAGTRRAAEANMQRLPGGVQPQPTAQPAGCCHVCYNEDYTDDNLLLEVHICDPAHIPAVCVRIVRCGPVLTLLQV